MQYDVFNGDADGICALHQLRLAEPRPSAHLITGVKRDIRLLGKIENLVKDGDDVTVLDISMDTNKDELTGILAKGCSVFYADHHFAGEIPDSVNLTSHIDPDSNVCTSLIVDQLLNGRYRAWAIAAAFGDNLHGKACQVGATISLSEKELDDLRELGELLNYNGYGATLDDLHYTPQVLYQALRPFADPLEFFEESKDLAKLRNGFNKDMSNANQLQAVSESEVGRIYRFPAKSWSKRVAGVFSNEKAREKNNLAHALLVDNGDGTIMTSVRAPLLRKKGADTLCRAFPTGGGRAAAAGINALPEAMLSQFIDQFEEIFTP